MSAVRWKGWSERRRAGEAKELLAVAGGVFDRSLDPRQTMRAIASIAVPRLAEMCVINLLREDGTVGDTVAVAVREEAVTQLESLRAKHPLDLDGEHPVARAIRSREPVVVHDLTDARTLEQIAPESEYREFIAWSGYHSAVVMPLIARGRLLGALSFFYIHDGRHYDPEHLALMRDLADRAAMALDNASLYAARTQLARTLQRSLLPETLPVLEGVALSSAYHPAGEGSEVGGDFYDVFATPFGCWLVVGDVCGKGPEAAAVTALVRHSIRAFAFVRASPAQVLGAVNEVMLGHDLAHRFATVVVVRLDLRRDPVKATIAGAGHPPPLLLGVDGLARCPSAHGMMLGVRSGSNVVDIELELAPGSTLVLYTDGLLDAGAPRRGLTPRELCRLLAGHAGAAPQLLVQQLERLALSSGAGRLRDDVAIVAARVDG
ncbi:MAG TPA: GAF domain-containing SpoIIE family protein phosphatase [Solirubrobacteraceae bacterium]|nr:GAF domain-containing SpoIIE family protein phosphatase [Solirubrobacteraceae bacterium]